MSSNQGAWLRSKGERPLVVGPADLPKAGPGQLVIKNHAVAINPIDYKIQDLGIFIQKYPTLIGSDVSGEVVQVGEGVEGFQKGDRILSYSTPAGQGFIPEVAAFQNFTRVPTWLASKIPSGTPSKEAAVLPLALATASAGLYQSDYLGLPYPTHDPSPLKKILVVWGGSSSVGSATIQLAKASGVQVITTASSRNLSFVKSAGADHAFDHDSASVVEDIVSTIKDSGKEFAGVYDAIGIPETIKKSVSIFGKVGSGSNKLASTLPVDKDLVGDVDAKQVNAGAVFVKKEFGQAIYNDFVPGALESGQLKTLPPPQVVGKGLDAIQKGLDTLRNGVSATKIVIEL
ncbi:GroES-like protein [Myriangium duriaei CBS 260.36]|uniref:GroES-like protein n=1 Tax=Myriangium duriaei CBS 260.36 TaxID=1168546 RepID=A0A9P4MES0_9PEZI|nr:GroES-like protein [Myriangium duriaei CBS 260.36]